MRYFFMLAIAILLTAIACNQTADRQDKKATLDDSASTQILSNSSYANYQSFITSLDTNDIQSIGKATQKFKALFTEGDSTVNDSAFLLFDKLWKKVELNAYRALPANVDLTPLVDIETGPASVPIPEQLKPIYKTIHTNGYRISSSEGMFTVIQNGDFLSEHFYPYLSKTMQIMLGQLNQENKLGFADDGAIIINAEEFTNRLIWWEKFIHDFPTFPALAMATSKYKEYLTFYILGMNNTPARQSDKSGLEDYFQNAYTQMQAKYPNSKSNQWVSPYFEAFKKKNYTTVNQIIKDYREQGIIM